MPKDFRGFDEQPNIQASHASGGRKYKQGPSGYSGRSESHLTRSEADKPGKGKSKAPKPDTYRSR